MTKLTKKIDTSASAVELPKLIPPLRHQGNAKLDVTLFRSPKKSGLLSAQMPNGSESTFPPAWSETFARDASGGVWVVGYRCSYNVRRASTADIRALAAALGVSQKSMATHVDSLRSSEQAEWEREQYEQMQQQAARYGFKLVRDLSATPERQTIANKIRAHIKRK